MFVLHKKALLFVVVFALIIGIGTVLTQDMPPLPGEVILTDLGSPRGLAFDDNGNLFVADSGFGDEQEITITRDGEDVTSNVGLGGRVVSLSADGVETNVIAGLPSYKTSDSRADGLYRVIPQGDSLWLIFSGSGKTTAGTYWRNSIVEISALTLATRTIINLDEFETLNDPDGNGFDTNVGDIAWSSDGTMYIVDVAGNDLLSWTEDDGLQVVTAWPDNPVPTAIEIADNDDIYVSFLGTGMAEGVAFIEHWADGELVETFEGLTAVTDILLDGDDLYAVEFVGFVEDEAGAGRVVKVTADGNIPIIEDLIAPFAIAKYEDELYVTYSAVAFVPDLPGGVLKVSLDALQLDASTSSNETMEDVVMLVGDLENGREIFRSGINDAQRCANCHRVTTRGFAVDAGPNLEGVGTFAGERVDGMSAEDYIRQSIIDPLAFVVVGEYANPMPEDYAELLSDQQIEDLVTYMMQFTS